MICEFLKGDGEGLKTEEENNGMEGEEEEVTLMVSTDRFPLDYCSP